MITRLADIDIFDGGMPDHATYGNPVVRVAYDVDIQKNMQNWIKGKDHGKAPALDSNLILENETYQIVIEEEPEKEEDDVPNDF